MRRQQVELCFVLLLLSGCSAGEGDWKGDRDPVSTEPAANLAAPHSGPLEEALERWQREFSGSFGEPLPEYAAKCDIATGIHVPDFNCSSGTLVPDGHPSGSLCDTPNRLNRECDPGSRFQIVAQSADAVAVAHCRRRGLTGNNYADVAVIQYNKTNGATCFYQALSPPMDGNFKAPSAGTSLSSQANTPNPAAAPWLSASATKAIGCAGCHDNGTMIRSPYLAQIAFMPGQGDNTYNKTQPVKYIGTDFQDWKIYSVQVSGNLCTNCHRQGTNSIRPGGGTARDFALRATATSEVSKNPHSPDSPIWMTPGQVFYSASNESQAQQISSCAAAWASNPTNLPSGCTVSPLSTPWTGLTPVLIAISPSFFD
jgi:hypothetical protein